MLASVSEERTGYHKCLHPREVEERIDGLDVGVCKKVNSRQAQKKQEPGGQDTLRLERQRRDGGSESPRTQNT